MERQLGYDDNDEKYDAYMQNRCKYQRLDATHRDDKPIGSKFTSHTRRFDANTRENPPTIREKFTEAIGCFAKANAITQVSNALQEKCCRQAAKKASRSNEATIANGYCSATTGLGRKLGYFG